MFTQMQNIQGMYSTIYQHLYGHTYPLEIPVQYSLLNIQAASQRHNIQFLGHLTSTDAYC